MVMMMYNDDYDIDFYGFIAPSVNSHSSCETKPTKQTSFCADFPLNKLV